VLAKAAALDEAVLKIVQAIDKSLKWEMGVLMQKVGEVLDGSAIV